jgi:tetratricopeptide (TPR) repeat protein
MATAAMAVLFLVLCVPSAHAGSSTISGTVYDKARNPIADLDVELLDEYHRSVMGSTGGGRQRTSSSGRYEFGGLNNGRYYVKVWAFRYDLEDEEHEVVLSAVSGIPGQQGSDFRIEDFYLQPKRGGLRDAELSVIFAQSVPKDAEKAYKQAVEDLSKKRADQGFVGLQTALTIFPQYYAALMRYGQELMAKEQYTAATQIFMSAAEVNQKAALPYYYAANCLVKLGGKYLKNANIALDQALVLAPASTPVLLLAGTVERKLGKFAEAEKHLLQAKKLSPNRVPEIQKELSQLYANDLKKYKEAADEFEQYVKASKLNEQEEAKAKQTLADLRAKAKVSAAN